MLGKLVKLISRFARWLVRGDRCLYYPGVSLSLVGRSSWLAVSISTSLRLSSQVVRLAGRRGERSLRRWTRRSPNTGQGGSRWWARLWYLLLPGAPALLLLLGLVAGGEVLLRHGLGSLGAVLYRLEVLSESVLPGSLTYETYYL